MFLRSYRCVSCYRILLFLVVYFLIAGRPSGRPVLFMVYYLIDLQCFSRDIMSSYLTFDAAARLAVCCVELYDRLRVVCRFYCDARLFFCFNERIFFGRKFFQNVNCEFGEVAIAGILRVTGKERADKIDD